MTSRATILISRNMYIIIWIVIIDNMNWIWLITIMIPIQTPSVQETICDMTYSPFYTTLYYHFIKFSTLEELILFRFTGNLSKTNILLTHHFPL